MRLAIVDSLLNFLSAALDHLITFFISNLDLFFLLGVGFSLASKQKGVPQAGSVRKETVGVEMTVAFSYFNRKLVGPRCQMGLLSRN